MLTKIEDFIKELMSQGMCRSGIEAELFTSGTNYTCSHDAIMQMDRLMQAHFHEHKDMRDDGKMVF